jgi:hypothetical protein
VESGISPPGNTRSSSLSSCDFAFDEASMVGLSGRSQVKAEVPPLGGHSEFNYFVAAPQVRDNEAQIQSAVGAGRYMECG